MLLLDGTLSIVPGPLGARCWLLGVNVPPLDVTAHRAGNSKAITVVA